MSTCEPLPPWLAVVRRLTRDFVVSAAATSAFLYEVLLGGGRPAVLTACVSILLSPVIMRVDEARRAKSIEGQPDE